jgi:glycosyltransferase involved in cell wall biosynthesis
MKNFNSYLDSLERPVKATYISSYIPRKCGIATFTKDLTTAINALNPQYLAQIVALQPEIENLTYPWEVKQIIAKQDVESYKEAARRINESDCEAVSLQHEFGLFGGGSEGEFVLTLIKELHKPVVTTVHTILDNPSEAHKAVFTEICQRSAAVVVMLPNVQKRLEEVYGISSDNVVVIHHGVAGRPFSTKENKPKFGWQDKKVLLMSGLIGPDKGIDYAIEAMPKILAQVPNAELVIVGQTHPEILAAEGEKYRNSLIALTEKLGCANHVTFVNEYQSLTNLLAYYEACDIFLTPHLNPQQVTSGTLAYAIGLGKATISTNYRYATEVLAEDRGILVDFKNSDQIADAAVAILTKAELQATLENNAYDYGRQMSWPRVAERYLNLFRAVAHL